MRVQVLQAFHHPYYATGRSRIQDDMFQEMQRWVQGLEDERATLGRLTKVCCVSDRIIYITYIVIVQESVRAGRNKRQGSDNDMAESNQVYEGSVPTGGYGKATRPTYEDVPSVGGIGGRYSGESYDSQGQGRYSASEAVYESEGYGSSQHSYGRTEDTYGSSQGTFGAQYGSSEDRYGATQGYGSTSPSGGYRPPDGPPPGRYTSEYSTQQAYSNLEEVSGGYGSTYAHSGEVDSGMCYLFAC